MDLIGYPFFLITDENEKKFMKSLNTSEFWNFRRKAGEAARRIINEVDPVKFKKGQWIGPKKLCVPTLAQARVCYSFYTFPITLTSTLFVLT